MSDIVVFISKNFTDADKEKIAESMRIHKIETTTDKHIATVILEPNLKKTTQKTIPMALDSAPKNLTLADIAQIVIDETHGEIFKLKESFIPCISVPTITHKKSHHKKLRTYDATQKQFRTTKNIRKVKIFNNLRHK